MSERPIPDDIDEAIGRYGDAVVAATIAVGDEAAAEECGEARHWLVEAIRRAIAKKDDDG